MFFKGFSKNLKCTSLDEKARIKKIKTISPERKGEIIDFHHYISHNFLQKVFS